MKFNFEGVRVEVADGEVICEDPTTKMIIAPLLASATAGPEDGNPLILLLTGIYGKKTITHFEDDEIIIN
jgi:hypothetical protein